MIRPVPTYNPIKLSMGTCLSSQFVQNPYNPIGLANQHTACLNCFSRIKKNLKSKNPQHSGDSSGQEGHGCLPFLLAYLLLLLLLGLPVILLELFLGQYSALPPGRSACHLNIHQVVPSFPGARSLLVGDISKLGAGCTAT